MHECGMEEGTISNGKSADPPGNPVSLQSSFDTTLARMIDHTLLKPDAALSQIDRLCDEAMQYGFASVCVNPGHVKRCAVRLASTNVKVCTVIGFPLGATSTEAKVYEAEQAIRDGAQEIDMVINIGMLKSGEEGYVGNEIRSVVNVAKRAGMLTKVILETALLTDDEKRRACELAKEGSADFVKTSTGFAKGGATVEDVRLMRQAVGSTMGVKASGGIRTSEDARALVASGASRLGTSASIQIVTGGKGTPASAR
jgi:deoxyribose-phosphate aldolase